MLPEVLLEREEDGLFVKEEVSGPRVWKGRADDSYTIDVRVEALPIFEGGLRYEELCGRFSVKLGIWIL